MSMPPEPCRILAPVLPRIRLTPEFPLPVRFDAPSSISASTFAHSVRLT